MANSQFKNALLHIITRPPALALKIINRHIANNSRDQPFHEPEWFPWIPEMERLYPEVLQELAPFVADRSLLPLNSDLVPLSEYYYESSDWRHLIFKFAGQPLTEICDLYPNTACAIATVPGVLAATVSLLGPRQTIAAHTHPYKGFLVFHFAIVVPRDSERCTIRNGSETRGWTAGKVLVIDPTFEHEVINDTDDVRIVVMGEFKRPDQPASMKIFDWLFFMLMKYSPMGKDTARKIHEEAAKFRKPRTAQTASRQEVGVDGH